MAGKKTLQLTLRAVFVQHRVAYVRPVEAGGIQARTMQAWSPSDNPFEALRKSLEELWAARAERTDEALVVADLLALSLVRQSEPKTATGFGTVKAFSADGSDAGCV